MRSIISIYWNSLGITIEELYANKLRSFLSILGVTFGIFCIISISATVRSLKMAITEELKAIGNHVIYIQKYPSGQGEGYEWWKYVKRPEVSHAEMALLQKKMPEIKNIALLMYTSASISYGDNIMSGVNHYGISEKFNVIETVPVSAGRYFLPQDFDNSADRIIVGNTVAERLFGDPLHALNREVTLKGGIKAIIIGVIGKQGMSILDAFDYDHSVLMIYSFMRRLIPEENANPVIMLQGGQLSSTDMLREEARGAMRSIRKLRPTEIDNFALNDIEGFSRLLDSVFYEVEVGGWGIATLSLLVGMFGVANIMFVSVRERTWQIGLKKAVGAKRKMIVAEFLLESICLCLLGGCMGIAMVIILARVLPSFLGFKVYVGADVIAMAINICVFVGVLSGVIPAIKASRMDPVLALRS